MVHPDPHPSPKDDDEKPKLKMGASDNRDLWRLLGLGVQLTVTVAVFAALGNWLDKKYGWTWGSIGFGLFGVAVGLYAFVRESLR